MQKYLKLSDELLLAKGGERFCFIHPEDNTKIIKVLNPSLNKHNQQNLLEYKYYSFLYSHFKSKELTCISRFDGLTNTNYGEGLIFERIVDYDGKDSKHLRHYLRNNLLSQLEEKYLLNELKLFLEKYNILFIDVSTVNLFCKRIGKDRYKLIIFDGLGARRIGFKFNLYLKSKIFTKYKIKKQWKKFYANYLRDKELS